MKNIKTLFYKIFRLYIFQNKYSSVKEHDKQNWKIDYYNDYKNLKRDAKKKLTETRYIFNHPFVKMMDFLKIYKNIRYTAVDMGSGDGWMAARLSKYFGKIIAIEPSKFAIKIAKNRYSKYQNIKWLNAFAEDCIGKLKFTKPTLFVTGHVLSHLTNRQVLDICKILNSNNIPKNSIFNFSELYTRDKTLNKFIDSSRSIDWWRINLSNWKINFHGPKVTNSKYEQRYKGFWGVKLI